MNNERTHILGILQFNFVQFDFECKNIFPESINNKKDIEFELSTINYAFNINKPKNFEDSLEINTIIINKCPTIIITGDLKNFGRNNIPIIINWLNKSYKIIRKKIDDTPVNIKLITLRDIDVNIELITDLEREYYYVIFIPEEEKFKCYVCNSYDYVTG